MGEPACEQFQRALDLFGLLRHVPRDDEPVLVAGRVQPVGDGTVVSDADMEIADCEKPATAVRRVRRGPGG